jgi:hypothetical protein
VVRFISWLLSVETAIQRTEILQPEITNQPFGREIATRRVVLMKRGDRDAVARSGGGDFEQSGHVGHELKYSRCDCRR